MAKSIAFKNPGLISIPTLRFIVSLRQTQLSSGHSTLSRNNETENKGVLTQQQMLSGTC